MLNNVYNILLNYNMTWIFNR